MTEQEIRDNAPSGATHYRSDTPTILYYYFDGGILMVSCEHGDFVSRSSVAIDRAKPL
jgi:hypothetical protein